MSSIMIFDGECVLCNGAVRMVLAHERAPELTCTTTQSDAGRALAARHGISAADLDITFVLVEGERALLRSDAALRVATYLRSPWSWLAVLRFVPRPVRDVVYSAIARRRYRLFGKYESCVMPDRAQRHRFVVDPPAATL